MIPFCSDKLFSWLSLNRIKEEYVFIENDFEYASGWSSAHSSVIEFKRDLEPCNNPAAVKELLRDWETFKRFIGEDRDKTRKIRCKFITDHKVSCTKHGSGCTCVSLWLKRPHGIPENILRSLEKITYEYCKGNITFEFFHTETSKMVNEKKYYFPTTADDETFKINPNIHHAIQYCLDKNFYENLYNGCVVDEEEFVELYELCYNKNRRTKEIITMSDKKNSMFQKIAATMMKEAPAKIDMTTGKIGISTKEGLATLATNEDGSFAIHINAMDDITGFDIPGFAVKTALSAISVGDIIVDQNDKQGFVIGASDSNTVEVLKPNGQKTSYRMNKTNMGQEGFFIVKNIFGDTSNMQSMLPMLMMMNSDDSGKEGKNKMGMMMAMMAMQNGGNQMGGMNPMMMALMMDKF